MVVSGDDAPGYSVGRFACLTLYIATADPIRHGRVNAITHYFEISAF
jgi:hypothetical protein